MSHLLLESGELLLQEDGVSAFDLEGVDVITLDTDMKYAVRVVLTEPGNLAKVSVLLDGFGPGSGQQVAKVEIYEASEDGSGALVTTSEEVSVPQGMPQSLLDFTFPAEHGALQLLPDAYDVAVHGGLNSDVIRLYGIDPLGAGGKWTTDSYADGPSATFGTPTKVTNALTLYVSLFKPYSEVKPIAEDLYYARLPYADAQEQLASAGADVGTQKLVDVGWHSTFLDPEQGSNALVREGSIYADAWIGQRLKITTIGVARPRSAYVYVHDLAPADLGWDLSVTRKVFAQLGLLSDDTVSCVVEVAG